jgi:hypothetical protein
VGSYLIGHEPTITNKPLWTQMLVIPEVDRAE